MTPVAGESRRQSKAAVLGFRTTAGTPVSEKTGRNRRGSLKPGLFLRTGPGSWRLPVIPV